MKNHHNSIHKLVHAIRELNHADAIVTQSRAIDHIREARSLCWAVGEELGLDIAEQLRLTQQTN